MNRTATTDRSQVQLIGLKNIVVDHDIQSRVVMDMNAAQEFSDALLRGDVFPPADVFWDGSQYLLADGFHRFEAHKHIGRQEMRCVIRHGNRRDALIFSAGANKQFSVKRTPADVRKAICILLEDDEWFNHNDAQIASHVGCAGQTVWRVREEFCRESNIKPPTEFIDVQGHMRPARRQFSVKRRVAALRGAPEEDIPSVYSLEYSYIRDWFVARFGFSSVVEQGHGATFPGIKAIYRKGKPSILLTPCDFALNDSLPLAVGRLLLARQIIKRADRTVILCYPEHGPERTMTFAENLDIEFVTPETMLVTLKGDSQ